MKQIRTGDELVTVNLTSVDIKLLGAKWIVRMFKHISNVPHLVINGFIASGIIDTVSDALKDIEADEEDDTASDNGDDTGSDNVGAVFPSDDVDPSL